MKKVDARKLPPAAQAEKRRTAIKLWKKSERLIDIAETLDVSSRAVQNWVNAYRSNGMTALISKKRGRKTGSGRRLSQDQEAQIRCVIIDQYPDQFKLNYALWTRKAIMELITQTCGITLPIRTIGGYLKRWGFTPQKPAKQAYEQSTKAVKKWLDEDYPEISKQAQKDNAAIYWGDETGMRSNSQHGRGYAPKGKTPVIRLNAKRCSLNMISAITNQGKVRFQIYEGTMNAQRLIEFLKRLIKSANQKVYLILDNLRVHHAKKVKAWLLKNEEKIAIFYLPSYSPELNPDEYLNCDLKAGVHSGKPARSQRKLKEKVLSHMRMLQKKPFRVASYFRHSKIKYAA